MKTMDKEGRVRLPVACPDRKCRSWKWNHGAGRAVLKPGPELPDTPETVAAKAQAAHAVMDRAVEMLTGADMGRNYFDTADKGPYQGIDRAGSLVRAPVPSLRRSPGIRQEMPPLNEFRDVPDMDQLREIAAGRIPDRCGKRRKDSQTGIWRSCSKLKGHRGLCDDRDESEDQDD